MLEIQLLSCYLPFSETEVSLPALKFSWATDSSRDQMWKNEDALPCLVVFLAAGALEGYVCGSESSSVKQ